MTDEQFKDKTEDVMWSIAAIDSPWYDEDGEYTPLGRLVADHIEASLRLAFRAGVRSTKPEFVGAKKIGD